MKTYMIAGAICDLGAVAVTSCALGMFLQSKRSKSGVSAVISALKDESRHETAKALGNAAVADPVVTESLKEALQEREIAMSQSEMAVKAREQMAAENSAQSLLKRKHHKFIEDALLSLAKGDIEDAKLSLELARNFGINDPETRALEMKVETAILDVHSAQKKAANDALQAQQQQRPADPDAAKKKPAKVGDQNPFE